MTSANDDRTNDLSVTPPKVPPSTPVCQKDEFQCSNGRCISSVLRCNYFNDCEDYGSDEIHCNKKGALGRSVVVLTVHIMQRVMKGVTAC